MFDLKLKFSSKTRIDVFWLSSITSNPRTITTTWCELRNLTVSFIYSHAFTSVPSKVFHFPSSAFLVLFIILAIQFYLDLGLFKFFIIIVFSLFTYGSTFVYCDINSIHSNFHALIKNPISFTKKKKLTATSGANLIQYKSLEGIHHQAPSRILLYRDDRISSTDETQKGKIYARDRFWWEAHISKLGSSFPKRLRISLKLKWKYIVSFIWTEWMMSLIAGRCLRDKLLSSCQWMYAQCWTSANLKM